MTRVTRASIAYIVTQVREPAEGFKVFIFTMSDQVRFSLSSSSVFSRTDTVTDSERFYTSVLDLLEDSDEVVEVNNLLEWWDR